jgi:hypothetical protein
LQKSYDPSPDTIEKSIHKGWILHDFSPVEGWAEHGGMRHLPAQTATDAALDDARYRIRSQRRRIRLD